MKLPAFDYRAPTSVEEATALLGAEGSDASVLAGGQSLLLDLRYERVRPGVLVDVNGLPGLAAIGDHAGSAEVGALVRHRALESADCVPGPLGPLLAEAAPFVAHAPIRARGTLVGSLCWAHPAAEWCAVALLAEAEIVTSGPGGERVIGAAEWFLGERRTARRPDELVLAVRLPPLPPGTGVAFAEHRRTHASFALVAVAASVTLDAAGAVTEARISLAGAADRPLRATDAESALRGAAPTDQALRAAAEAAAVASDPADEPHASAGYRRHVVRVLTKRALGTATTRPER